MGVNGGLIWDPPGLIRRDGLRERVIPTDTSGGLCWRRCRSRRVVYCWEWGPFGWEGRGGHEREEHGHASVGQGTRLSNNMLPAKGKAAIAACDLDGVPSNAAAYRGHGLEARATLEISRRQR